MDTDALRAWLGKSKTAARRVVAAYLKTLPVDVRLSGDVRLQALGAQHPTRKIPTEAVFVVGRKAPFHTLALHVESRTGGYVDFSWVKCVENFYGQHSRQKDVRGYTLSALRSEAARSKASQEARNALGDVCSRCHARCHRLVLDHAGMPFAQIVDEFLKLKGLNLEQLRIKGTRRGGFRLAKFGRAWRKFHDEHAQLEGLCAHCNGSLGSRGYRHVKSDAIKAATPAGEHVVPG